MQANGQTSTNKKSCQRTNRISRRGRIFHVVMGLMKIQQTNKLPMVGTKNEG